MHEKIRTIIKKPFFLPVCVLITFVLFAAFVNLPFFLHPGSTLIAPGGGDIDGSVAKYEAMKGGNNNPFFTSNFNWISYPDGPKNNVGVDRVSALSVTYLWIASIILGAITAHSLFSVLGYILTAFIMFLFVRRVTGSNLAGLIAGFAYGFWPQMYTLASSDMTYTHMWLYILPIWAFWLLIINGYSRKRVLMSIISIIPAVFWTPYYMFHALVIGLTCLFITGIYLFIKHGGKLASYICGIVLFCWVILFSAYRYIGLHSPSTTVPARTLDEIYLQSAHPFMYIFPGKFSWGTHGDSLLVNLVPRANWINLYLGISVITLAIIGVICVLRNIIKNKAALQEHYIVAAILAFFIVIACFLFSLPPTFKVDGIVIPTPNFLVSLFVPALRAGQRFVMPLMAGMAVLAGLGAWFIFKNLKPSKRGIITAILLVIIGLDLWALPPQSTIRTLDYPSLSRLKSQPLGPVAQYDDGSLLNAPPQLPCLLQHEYNMPLINDCGLGRSVFLGRILELPLCDQIMALQSINTRYIILKPTDIALINCLQKVDAKDKIISTDPTFEVVRLKKIDTSKSLLIKSSFQLP